MHRFHATGPLSGRLYHPFTLIIMTPKTHSKGLPSLAFLLSLVCLLLGFSAVQGQSSQLPLARQLADQQVQAILNTPASDPMLLKQRLFTILQNNPIPYLTDAESVTYTQYIQSKANLVQAKINQFKAAYAALPQPPLSYGSGICYTFCIGFLEFYCETGTMVGFGLGVWDCSAGIGAHTCLSAGETSTSDCGNEGPCPPGWRCARWAFKPHECVKECSTNSDCPPGQTCKKPFGTSFKRCK
jgi:hypothetical protein